MTINRYTMGPGSLTLGVAGAEDITAQVTDMAVEWSESTNSTDAIPTLSDEEIPSEDSATYTASLTGNVVQDIDAGGMVDYTWLNPGVEVPFSFIPNTAEGREVSGTVRIIPIKLGGTVKDKAPRSDITWGIVGHPVLGDV